MREEYRVQQTPRGSVVVFGDRLVTDELPEDVAKAVCAKLRATRRSNDLKELQWD